MKPLQPVIKWSGSKRTVASQLGEFFLPAKTYYEPFVGGGAMMPFAKSEKGKAGDIIPELIALWNEIKYNPQNVATEYELRWNRLQKEGYQVFYEIRDTFNKNKNPFDFLFLTRTCLNGMIRYNSAGEFNNSLHLTRPGIAPKRLASIINQWNFHLKKFNFLNADYRESLEDVKAGDFVFLDPPYGGTKSRYTKTPFSLPDLFHTLDLLNSKGVNWMLTFDGSSGERKYSFAPPEELYKSSFRIRTGKSAFRKVVDKVQEDILETVYLNYKSTLF
ncbi:MAG: Dam family site-specific DNA-(adenine-N6)-methyltransferase [Prevotella sp.]|nr:Dam family site-specific DNA-(adenine-N6)-methyltransferase [Prevotella sp.]